MLIQTDPIDNWNSKLFMKIYFPYLFSKKIYNLGKLYKKKKTQLKKDAKTLNKEYNEHVDLFYDIYYKSKKEDKLNYTEEYPQGIKKLHCIMHLTKHIKFPLDIIFKLIHASDKIPFIKYNPGSHREKIYRIYTNQISKDGKKIPKLSKGTDSSFAKSSGAP